ncbi:HEPN domain-containing protein [candidate division KSB1 bacterium]|nr:HEPN domain-containing protein [candidate division KSB1 bacterium]
MHSAELLRSEGDYDSSTSRLYYAMFYCAEAALLASRKVYCANRSLSAAHRLTMI